MTNPSSTVNSFFSQERLRHQPAMRRLLAFLFTEEARIDLEDAHQGAESLETHKRSGDATVPLDEVESWLFKNEKAHASVMRGLEQAQRGEFADPPDLDEGERLAAMIPD